MQPANRSNLKHKVLIADFDTHFARRLADYMWDHGYEARVVHTVAEARSSIQSWQPDVVFANLILPESNAIGLVRFTLQSKHIRKKPVFTVMSKQVQPGLIDEVRKAGVRFSLLKPFPLEDALNIVALSCKGVQVEEKRLPEADPVKELHLLSLILKQASVDSGMFNLMRMINIKVRAIRSSLIQYVDDNNAIVLASNDDENVKGLLLNLKNYPEVAAVRATGRSLIIPNVRTSDLLAPVQEKLQQTPFETIVLFPVRRQGNFFGVLSLRMEQKSPVDMFYVEKFGEVCSHILALSLGHHGQPAATKQAS